MILFLVHLAQVSFAAFQPLRTQHVSTNTIILILSYVVVGYYIELFLDFMCRESVG